LIFERGRLCTLSPSREQASDRMLPRIQRRNGIARQASASRQSCRAARRRRTLLRPRAPIRTTTAAVGRRAPDHHGARDVGAVAVLLSTKSSSKPLAGPPPRRERRVRRAARGPYAHDGREGYPLFQPAQRPLLSCCLGYECDLLEVCVSVSGGRCVITLCFSSFFVSTLRCLIAAIRIAATRRRPSTARPLYKLRRR